MPLLLVAIAALLILFLLYLRFYKDKTEVKTQKHPEKKPLQETKGKDDGILSKQPYNAQAHKEQLYELFPSLMDIPQYYITDEDFPTPLKDINENIIKKVQEKLSSIKPIPANYVNLLSLLKNPESSTGDISAIISTNPVFTARILQIVNSAYFGLNYKVTSLGRAITLLGYNNVRALVLQDSLSAAMPKQHSNLELFSGIWLHSAVVSVCAGYLGKKIFNFSEYDLATIGLLHDIGKYYYQLIKSSCKAAPDIPDIIQEEKRYGINHATLGSIIVKQWQLSENVDQSIAYHHYPNFLLPDSIPEDCLRESFIICLSDFIAKALGYKGQEENILPIKEEYFRMLNVSQELPELIGPSLVKEIEKTHAMVETYIKATM